MTDHNELMKLQQRQRQSKLACIILTVIILLYIIALIISSAVFDDWCLIIGLIYAAPVLIGVLISLGFWLYYSNILGSFEQM